MKLRTKLAVALIALTLVLSLATYGGLELYKDRQVTNTRDAVNQSAGVAATQVRSDVNDYRTDLAFVASRVDGDNLSRSPRTVGPFLNRSRFFAAYVAAANGTIVAAVGPFGPADRDRIEGTPITTPCANRTLRTGDTCVSGVLTAADGPPYVVMSAPVFEDGRVAGVVAAPIYADEEAFFSSISTLQTDERSAWVSYEGQRLYGVGRRFPNALEASEPVGDTGLVVHVARDRGPLNARLRALALAQGAGIFLVVAGVVALGFWEYRVNLSQTERLLDAFEAAEAGDYGRRLSLDASEEWVEISEGFNGLVTGIREREAVLREREQRLDVLNRVLRHNVRNETTIVFSYADMIAESVDDDEVAEMAETAGDAGRRLADLGEQARRAEKALADAAAEPGAVDLSTVVADGVAEVAEEYPAVDVRTTLPEQRWVQGSPALSTATAELVENACKHNDADEPWVEVTVDTDRETGETRLRVADNGPGVPDHERGAIETGRETSLDHASGLGLWLVYWLVDRCDGDLSFADREGGGAVVTCRFAPATAPDDPAE